MSNTGVSNKDKCSLVFELLQFVVQILAGIFVIIFLMHCIEGYEEMLTDYIFAGILVFIYFALEVCIELINKDEQLDYWKLVDQKRLKNKESNKNEQNYSIGNNKGDWLYW